MTRLGMLACAASLWTTTASAATLAERLGSLIAAHDGQVAVVVKHLGTGETFAHNADVPMATASLIKFPVMVEAYRQAGEGKVDLKAMITLKDADKVPGSGILTIQFTEGMTLSLRDAIRLMIAYSDNTATNMVVDKIGLPATTAYMESLSLKHTRLHSKVYRRDTSIAPERSKEFGLGSTSAGEMLDLLERLHRRELVSRDASEAMFEHMLRCEDKSTISRYLPHGTKVAQKTGAVSDVRTSAGIILSPSGPIAICVLTSKNKDQSWTPDNAAEIFIAEVAREAYNHFQKAEDLKGAVVPDESALRIGSTGPRVEKLQRILNAKMTPSPGLSVDGDFGPGTEAAVLDYQKKNNLTANGVVGPEMWKALGEGPPPSGSGVPAPEVVNADRQPREAADPLDGMPWTTAKAWVAVDGRNGEVLGGKNDFAPLDMASTTKIMTALMVLRLAGKEPGVLDEVVTFSSRADQTVGSTSDVHSGERVTVRELLYGLLLPSGNDASVALAEQFGHRLHASDAPELDPLAAFVGAMNRTARELGLKDTHFENPHGLTARTHKSTARDLASLARTALETPGFSDYVGTRRHGSRLVDPSGVARDVIWANTNKLLGVDGYDGVKTGTTDAAGACLVASGRRGEAHLIVVVLGSASSESRYVDSRNIFRWGWRRLEQAAGSKS